MPTGLTAPLTGANFATMTVDELCDRHRELLQRIREVDHWQRLIAARLDLAVAAVADLPEPVPDPAPHTPALAAELGGPEVIRGAIDASGSLATTDLAALLGELEGTALPGGFEGFDADQPGPVAGRDGTGDALAERVGGGLAQIPVAFPPEGLRDLLGIARSEDRLVETALLPPLRAAAGQQLVIRGALGSHSGQASSVLAARLGTPRLPA
jgi:hypothetical protein